MGLWLVFNAQRDGVGEGEKRAQRELGRAEIWERWWVSGGSSVSGRKEKGRLWYPGRPAMSPSEDRKAGSAIMVWAWAGNLEASRKGKQDLEATTEPWS